MAFKRLSRLSIYKSAWINLYSDRVETEDGSIIENYHQLDYPKESVVVIVSKGNQICLIKSHRYTINKTNIELPAGYVENNEDPKNAVIREVKEETGLTISHPDFMFSFYPSNGMSNQIIHVFTVETKSDIIIPIKHEGIEDVFWMDIKDVEELVDSNKLTDGITLIALMKYLRSLNKE
ncbi:MAG: NUDIX hydrolase [Salinivirgaceae bacterium]|jgi:NADH pyrophosphatase NudC (nudix superfamily)|nr:NUDIX hydrolase [Salinivirgaceae bacterium]